MIDTADQQEFQNRTLGPYRIIGEIGSGAMGTVYRAVHTGLDRQVALKVLRSEMLQDGDSVRRFLREARSSARLEHPHIVAVYDAGEIAGQYYIAMKLLEGKTLQHIISTDGRIAPDRVIKMATQLAGALDYAHGRDVVHLDVKPANVIVGPSDQATLTDFSIAQALNPGATRSATIAGTPLYMSPEQIQGKELDSRSDIYSLGLMMYEMCVGHPPFQGQFVTVMYAHLHSPVPDMREPFPQIPEGLANIIYRALAKDRADRYQTAGEMVRALERVAPQSAVDVSGTVRLGREDMDALLQQAGGGSNAAPSAPPEAGNESSSKPVTRPTGNLVPILAIVLACLVIAALIWFLFLRTKGSGTRAGVAPVLFTALLVKSARLSTEYSEDPSTGQFFVGPSLQTLSVHRFRQTPVFAISELSLRRPAGSGELTITPQYQVVNPQEMTVSRFPAHPPTIILSAAHPTSAFVSAFRMPGASSRKFLPGTYQVRLTVRGRVVRRLSLAVLP